MGLFERFIKKREKHKNHKRELRKQELFLQVREILSQEFNIDKEKIKLESRFQDDLNLNSIDAIQVMIALEREFNFEIPDEDTEKIFTVAQIVDYLLTRLK